MSANYEFEGQVVAGQASVGVAFLFQQLVSVHYCRSLLTEAMVSKNLIGLINVNFIHLPCHQRQC